MPETVNPQESVFMKPLIFLLPAVLSLHAAAQNYVIADDRLSSGVLTLEGSSFSVSTVNPNGNVCDYEGIVRNRIARLPAMGRAVSCISVSSATACVWTSLNPPEKPVKAIAGITLFSTGFIIKCRRPAPRNMQRRRSGVSRLPIGTNVSERRQTSSGNI